MAANHITGMTNYIISRLRKIEFKDLRINLLHNWFIPMSAFFFLLLNTGMPTVKRVTFDSYISVFPSCLVILFLSLISPPVGLLYKNANWRVRVVALLSSLGVCFSTWIVFKNCRYAFGGNTIIIRTVCLILSIPFVYVACLLFWNKLEKLFVDLLFMKRVTKYERIIYIAIFLITCFYISFCFMSSRAFYLPDHVDTIYTSDSYSLVKYNAYIVIDHFENDLRQPLFAVFSAPLMGIPCLLGYLIPGIPMAMILDYAQVFILLIAVIVLAMQLDLSPLQRMCFTILLSSTYTYLLFSVMMEQYITAFFWLVLTISFIKNDKEAVHLSIASSGTLLVSGILVPFILKPQDKSINKILESLKRMFLFAFDFLLILVAAGRTHVICDVFEVFRIFTMHMGGKTNYSDRIFQYFGFIKNCFLAPDSSVQIIEEKFPCWHLSEITSFNCIGVVILVIAIAAFFVTRRELISKLALTWVIYSFVVLVIIGWGTSENGLNLYSLYFGWPFYVLIFNLMKAAEVKLKTKILIPVSTAVLSCALLFYNIPAVLEMVIFAINAYPV